MRPHSTSKAIAFSEGQTSSPEVTRVFRNTYLLLSLTLFFSAAMAWFAVSTQAPPLGLIGLLVGMFGFYFLTIALRNSPWGILAVFAYTGFMGYTLGPVLTFYIQNFSNGGQLITTAFGATAAIFFALTFYTITTGKNYSYLGGFISIGVLLAFVLGIGAAVFHLPMLTLVVSGAFA